MSAFPELDLWFKEGLFTRTNLGGYNFSIAQKQRFINYIRTCYFLETPANKNAGASKGSSGVFAIELLAWRRTIIKMAFAYITDLQMRDVMMAMILDPTQSVPLPSAHDKCRACGMRWVQFVKDFNYGLWQMFDAMHRRETAQDVKE